MEFKYLYTPNDGEPISCALIEKPIDKTFFGSTLFNIFFEDGTETIAGKWNISVKPPEDNPTHRFLHGSMCGSFYEYCNILEYLSNGKVRVVFFDDVLADWSYQDIDPEDLTELKMVSNNDAVFKNIT